MKRNNSKARAIHNLVQRATISPNDFIEFLQGNEKPVADQLWPLQDYFANYAPRKLFRLRKCSKNAMDALRNDEIYFTRADYFNDPYECLLQFDSNRLLDRIKEQISEERLKEYLRLRDIKFPIDDDLKNADDLISFCTKMREDFLENVEKSFANITEMLQKSTYIACLTETITSPIMWSHYSDYHKGFAIEYEFSPDYFSPSPHFPRDDKFGGFGWRSLLPVYYSKYRADGIQLADWFCKCEVRKALGQKDDLTWCLPDLLLKTKLSLTKAEQWAYEKEWRIVLTHEWPNEFGDPKIWSKKKATAIYIGTRTEEKDKKELLEIANVKDIPVFEMYIDDESREYEMKFREIK